MNTLLIDFKNTSDSELKLISSKFKINNDEVFSSMNPYKVEVPSEIVLDVDAILEKISEFGIDSLTSDEKDYLDNISKK